MKLILLLLLYLSNHCHCNNLTVYNQLNSVSITTVPIESILVKDLMDGSQRKNFILINTGLETECQDVTCEKYSMRNLEAHLENRGSKIRAQYWMDTDEDYVFNFKRNQNAGSSRNDVIILKFTAFSEIEINALRSVRTYDMKSYIVIIITDATIFSDLEHYLLKNFMFNVFILKATRKHDVYIMYEICAYCNDGKNEIRVYNSWKSSRGFVRALKYENSFKGQFFGATVYLGTFPVTPNIFMIGVTKSGEPVYEGMDVRYLKVIAKAMNFKLGIKTPPDGEACNPNYTTKDYDGFCKMLLNNEVQMAGFPNGYTFDVNHFTDPSSVYLIVNTVIISVAPAMKKEWSSMLNSLQPSVLVCLLLPILFLALIIWVTEKVSLNLKTSKKNQIPRTYTHSVLQFIAILFQEGIEFSNVQLCKQIIFGTWMICCFFFMSLILGQLTSVCITAKPENKVVNTPEDMQENSLSWITIPSYDIDRILKEKLPDLTPKHKKMQIKEGLQYILDHPKEYVYFFPRVVVEAMSRLYFWNGLSRNPFHYSPAVIGRPPHILTSQQRKDAPFTEDLTRRMLEMAAADVYGTKIGYDVQQVINRFANAGDLPGFEEKRVIAMTMETLMGVIIMLSFTLLPAVLIFLLEIRIRNKRKIFT